MVKNSLLVVFLIIISGTATAQSGSVTDVILKSYSARAYVEKPVSDSEIDMIVKSGLKAPSANNSQPWMFTVVKNDSLMKNIIPAANTGNILIVVSGPAEKPGTAFDCALATQNMYLAAQSIGLGSRIYGSPVKNVNSRMKQDLGIPENYSAVTILRVGNIDKSVDATSSASTRKNPAEMVVYK
jgi:nitroreductase